jgi:hypothetical protein
LNVFFHTRSAGQRDWFNEPRTFAKIPSVGDYVATASDGPWHRVELVVHTPFPCDFDAEVYAVKVDHLDMLNTALAG